MFLKRQAESLKPVYLKHPAVFQEHDANFSCPGEAKLHFLSQNCTFSLAIVFWL